MREFSLMRPSRCGGSPKRQYNRSNNDYNIADPNRNENDHKQCEECGSAVHGFAYFLVFIMRCNE
jgi:hypothetical protein